MFRNDFPRFVIPIFAYVSCFGPLYEIREICPEEYLIMTIQMLQEVWENFGLNYPTHLGKRDNIAVFSCVSTVSMKVSGFEFTPRACHILPWFCDFYVPWDYTTL